MHKRTLPILIVAVPAVAALCMTSRAADWPMYRADAARSGYTAEKLPETLALAWSHQAAAPEPAWPSDDRLAFDQAYQPVIAGATLYFGSSADGKIHALDAATGATRWTYFTDGPVRFAPVAWQGRVLAAADDGWLVCLNGADGKVQWRLRLAPKPDKILGNDRMISRWPARGGPVLADGVLYAAAGIWPSEGIRIHAIDPGSGKVLWCNDSCGEIEMDQPHPGARARSGAAAQGYLAVEGRRLLVPTGRAVPAVFDRDSGDLESFALAANGQRGGSDVVAFDQQWFNHGWLFPAGKGAKPVAIAPQVAVHPDWVITCRRDQLAAYERKQLYRAGPAAGDKESQTSARILAQPRWNVTLPRAAEAALIVAGDKAVAGARDGVTVVDLGSQRAVWTGQVKGTACGLAVARGRLYVSTDQGWIYCFHDAQDSNPAVEHTLVVSPPAEKADDYSAAADEILRRSGTSEGYCLDLGCGEGRLTLALARRSRLRIVAVDADPANIERLRLAADAAGWNGTRVTVLQSDPQRAPLPRWFADLIVSGRSVLDGEAAATTAAARRFQRPWGGVACFGKVGAMTVATRGPLEGEGQWTHQYADAANTLCSADTRLRGPLSMLWFRDTDLPMPNRHGRAPAPLVLQGRMFVEGLDALRAVNIFNGRTLWQTPLPGVLKAYHQDHLVGTAATGSNLCASTDRVFLARADRVTAFRPADGAKLGELLAPPRPDGKPAVWGFLACEGDTVFGSLADDEHVVKFRYLKSDMGGLWSESRLLFALDARSGKVKWTHAARDSIRHNAIAIGQRRVYLIDRPLATIDNFRFAAPAGKPAPKHETGRLAALDAETGKVLWQSEQEIFGTLLALSSKHDVLVMGYQPGAFQLPSEQGGRLAALRASDGKLLWDIKASYTARPILNDRGIYAQPGAWDLLTGQRLPFAMKRSYGCGIPAAAEHMLVFRSATIGYVDLLSPDRMENYGGIRPGCWVNTVPAGGLVLMADSASHCQCSYLNRATIALQPSEDAFHSP